MMPHPQPGARAARTWVQVEARDGPQRPAQLSVREARAALGQLRAAGAHPPRVGAVRGRAQRPQQLAQLLRGRACVHAAGPQVAVSTHWCALPSRQATQPPSPSALPPMGAPPRPSPTLFCCCRAPPPPPTHPSRCSSAHLVAELRGLRPRHHQLRVPPAQQPQARKRAGRVGQALRAVAACAHGALCGHRCAGRGEGGAHTAMGGRVVQWARACAGRLAGCVGFWGHRHHPAQASLRPMEAQACTHLGTSPSEKSMSSSSASVSSRRSASDSDAWPLRAWSGSGCGS